VAPRTKCCWQQESCILLAWQSPTSLHLHSSILLSWFEVLFKKLLWHIPSLWLQPTNHKAILYIGFGTFFFHLVVVHSNPHIMVEQIILSKKNLM
jgi:hypothetical protein